VKNLNAFTLVELLVSMAVLVLLAVLLLEITSAASRLIRLSNRQIDAASQVRLVFDRLGADLADLVMDDSTDFLAVNSISGTTNTLQFVSAVSSAGSPTGGNRGLSVVAYRLAASADNRDKLSLLRAGKPVGWENTEFRGLGADQVPMAFTDPTFPADLIPAASSDFDVLAPAVLQIMIGFQLSPDNLPVTLQDGTSVANARGQIVYSLPIRELTPAGGGPNVTRVDLSRVAAVIVGVAAIDSESQKLLTPDEVALLSAAFSGVPAVNQLPVDKWMTDTVNLSNLPTGVPLSARQAVRLYQRAFLLPKSEYQPL